MLQKTILAVLVGRLVLAPWAGAETPSPHAGPVAASVLPAIPAGPLRASAAREAARLARSPARGPMPGGLKWTGIGLLIGAGLPVFVARFGDCIRDDSHCRDQRHAADAVGGAMAATGVALLIIGQAKRPHLPSLVIARDRAVLQHRITF